MSFIITAITTNCRITRAFSPCGTRVGVASRIIRPLGVSCFSSASPQQQHQPTGEKIKLRNTGGLRRLPVVKSPTELMNKAAKAPKRVKNDAYVYFPWLAMFRLTCGN
jgi:hypothetical protein